MRRDILKNILYLLHIVVMIMGCTRLFAIDIQGSCAKKQTNMIMK